VSPDISDLAGLGTSNTQQPESGDSSLDEGTDPGLGTSPSEVPDQGDAGEIEG
jgi:hypothetical protein